MLFCHITTRIPGRKDDDLLGKKGGRGFPYLVYMDEKGDVLGGPSDRTLAGLKKGLKGAQHYLTLEKKADKTPAEEVELFTLQIQYGKLTLAAAKAKREKLKLAPEHDAKLAKAIGGLEATEAVKEAGKSLRSRRDIKTKGPEIGKGFYEKFFKKGFAPAKPQLKITFYILIMEYGFQSKVVEAAEGALNALKKSFNNPRAQQFFRMQEAKLAKLKEEVGGAGK